MSDAVFRPARPTEAGLLGELALRSKGYWGYDREFLDACRSELVFRPGDITGRRITVAEEPGRLLGFYSIDGQPPDGELGNLWVIPEAIGTGLGRRLWEHAMAAARTAGFTCLRIEADPHAEGFYRAMGAERVGDAPSGSVPDRTLPLLRFSLASPAGRPPTTSGR